jgi:flagellar biosynthetic protein FliR
VKETAVSALIATYQQQWILFLLVLTRVSGLIMTAPIFGPRSAPYQVRVLLILVLALIISPMCWSLKISLPDNLVELSILVAREAALGLALGLAVTVFFSSMQLSGTIIGQMSGLQLAEVFDPNFDTSVPVFGQFLDLIAIGAFVAMNGHRRVTAALLDTFRWRPPGQDDFPHSIVETLTSVLAESFVIAIRAAAPVMIALLLSVVILGLISRTVPQLNIFAVGFNINTTLVLAVLAFSLATLTVVVEQRADAILEAVQVAVSGQDSTTFSGGP